MKGINRIAVALGATLFLAATAAISHPGGGFGPGPGYGAGAGPFAGAGRGGPGRWGSAADVEERLAARKAAQQITAAQETQWNAFAALVRQQATEMQAHRDSMAGMTPMQRFEQRESLHAQRYEQRKAVVAAFDQLYAVLTPEQKALADQRGCGFGGRGRGRA